MGFDDRRALRFVRRIAFGALAVAASAPGCVAAHGPDDDGAVIGATDATGDAGAGAADTGGTIVRTDAGRDCASSWDLYPDCGYRLVDGPLAPPDLPRRRG
jgi:hypothetical protein